MSLLIIICIGFALLVLIVTGIVIGAAITFCRTLMDLEDK